MDKKAVYIETSVVSYLTARPTGDLLAAAWQKITLDWWETQRNRFDLYTSIVAIEEAGRGDPEAGARRLAALSDMALLPITEAVIELSKGLVRGGALPPKALNDALHVAAAAVHGVDYLLTWQPVVEPRVAPRSGRNNAAPGRRKARRGSKLGHL